MGSLTVRVGSQSAQVAYTVAAPTLTLGATEAAFDALTASVGPLRMRRTYDGAMPTSLSASKAQADVTAGRTPWVSFSSASAANMRPFLRTVKATGKPLWLTVCHEVNNGPKMTAAAFRQVYADLAAAKAAEGADNVTLAVILTAEPYRSGTYAQWMPDPANFDVAVADAYRFWRPPGSPPDPKTGTLGQDRTMAWLVGDLPAYAASIGKPWALGEFAAHPFPDDHANRPTWLRATLDWCAANGCIAAVYFHSGAGESGPWWADRFHFPETPAGTDPDSLAALAAYV